VNGTVSGLCPVVVFSFVCITRELELLVSHSPVTGI
jgi:hypothetical protein